MYPARSTRFLCTALPAVLIALAPAAAHAFKEVEPGSDPEWAPVTLLPAVQNVRLNLANVAVDNGDYMPGDCQVEVRFLDASGRAFGDGSVLELRPGQAATVTGPTPHMRDGETTPDTPDSATRLLRPMVRFVENPTTRSVGKPDAQRACSVVAVMEVFSEETGATLFLSPAVLKGFNPQPDPPGQEQQIR